VVLGGLGVDYAQGYGVSQPQKVQRAAIAQARFLLRLLIPNPTDSPKSAPAALARCGVNAGLSQLFIPSKLRLARRNGRADFVRRYEQG
jgi:hypothetical protein